MEKYVYVPIATFTGQVYQCLGTREDNPASRPGEMIVNGYQGDRVPAQTLELYRA